MARQADVVRAAADRAVEVRVPDKVVVRVAAQVSEDKVSADKVAAAVGRVRDKVDLAVVHHRRQSMYRTPKSC